MDWWIGVVLEVRKFMSLLCIRFDQFCSFECHNQSLASDDIQLY